MCEPSTLHRAACSRPTRRQRSARTSSPRRARTARASASVVSLEDENVHLGHARARSLVNAGLSPRMSSSHGRAHRRRTHKPPHGAPKEESKEEEDNPYFASVGIAKPSSPLLPLPRPASPSRQSPSRQSPSRQSPARLSPRQLRSGGGSGPAKPPTSRARLLKEAEAEEQRAAAAREEEQGRARRAGEKLLQLKSQRAQVESKLAEWEATFRRTHEREPTAVDRQRSSQHKELTKLIADLDRFISTAEIGAAPPGLAAAGGQLAGEREAERGKLKAKMRRWDQP